MKFRNPETGELFEDISDALESAYQCWDCPGIGGCPMGRKAMNYNMDCCSVAEKHAEKAARLMGYEVVEDDEPRTCFNCIGCEIEKDFDPQEGCKNWVKRKEANMDKPRICEVLGFDVGEQFYIADSYCNPYHITPEGLIEDKDGDVQDCIALDLINYPDRIIRRPRWTEQEAERAKAIKEIFPDAYKLARNLSAITIYRVEDDIPFYLATIQAERFHSLRPDETVTLDEIIGGVQ